MIPIIPFLNSSFLLLPLLALAELATYSGFEFTDDPRENA
jgi:hypothetical protein